MPQDYSQILVVEFASKAGGVISRKLSLLRIASKFQWWDLGVKLESNKFQKFITPMDYSQILVVEFGSKAGE